MDTATGRTDEAAEGCIEAGLTGRRNKLGVVDRTVARRDEGK